MNRLRERALNVACPMCLAPRDEPCVTSGEPRQWAHLTRVAASRDVTVQPLPEPMPGRLADGTRVWLHYRPLRWERTP